MKKKIDILYLYFILIWKISKFLFKAKEINYIVIISKCKNVEHICYLIKWYFIKWFYKPVILSYIFYVVNLAS